VLVLFGTSSGLGSSANVAVFFGAVALSRIGLFSYDLVGLQVLQVSLEHHPRRGRFTAMQTSLSSVFDLAKFAVVLVLHRPDQSVAPLLRGGRWGCRPQGKGGLKFLFSCSCALHTQVPLDSAGQLLLGPDGGEWRTPGSVPSCVLFVADPPPLRGSAQLPPLPSLSPQTLTYCLYLRKVRGHLLHWSYKGHGKDLGPNDPGPRRETDGERARLLREDEGR